MGYGLMLYLNESYFAGNQWEPVMKKAWFWNDII